jgi:hypothetical protein
LWLENSLPVGFVRGSNAADAIETSRETVEKAKSQKPTTPEEEEAQKKVLADQMEVLKRRKQDAKNVVEIGLRPKLSRTNVTAFKLLFQAAIDYGTEVEAFADAVMKTTAPDTEGEPVIVKPIPPDPTATMIRRHGPVYDAWFARLGFSAGSATLFDVTKPYGSQFEDKNFNGYS